ncbi:hypothetical protein [Rhodopila sp.]|uniref:hypothetical protein n=1 Tax=Rhodopila sp. TaxID=2480087 RepID=UPI003D117E84
MQSLTEFWDAVTPPQATIISGGLTLLAAVVGVVLGWRLFSGRVRDLKGALDASDKLLADHSASVAKALSNITDKVNGLDSQVATAVESLGTLRGNVSDLQIVTASTAEATNAGPVAPRDPPPASEKLRDDWDAIRDQLERRAANPAVDGRTRAKYARIDRRRYLTLIDALADDDALGHEAPDYREAATIWQRYRSGRSSPTPEDADKMLNLRQKLVGGS